MMVIDNKFNIGDRVYVITDIDQVLRIITGLKINPAGAIVYLVSFGNDEHYFYDIELSLDKDHVLATTN